MPHESGLAQDNSIARVSVGKASESSYDPLPEDNGRPQGQNSQNDPGFAYEGQSGADYSLHLDDEEDDDKESVADPPPLVMTYSRLVSFIHDRFPHSQPSTAAHVPPRCEFEDFFSISDPAPASRQNLKVYRRVSELVSVSADRASRLARECRALHRVVLLKRRLFYVGDKPFYCLARFLNPDFSRISKTKNILKTWNSSVTLSDLENSIAVLVRFLLGTLNVFGCFLHS